MTDANLPLAADIADAVRSGDISAAAIIADTLASIEALNPTLNCFTEVLAQRATERAAQLDARRAAGQDPGPLAGVPFAVKNLFDIAGVTTLAGSKINRDNPVATRDAVLVERLENAGAILVGALAMGEYAYDFTGENEHYGACRNPWDPARMSGGSSSGSGSATAAGLAPISLGSDTNGSIRVPSSLCGLFGLKPTYGRLPRTGSYPFCDSLDHLGPLARSSADLALAFDCLQGFDAGDPACAERPSLPTHERLDLGVDGLRCAVAGGYFDCTAFPEAQAAVAQVAAALGASRELELPGADAGRSAAYLVTNAEGAALHRERLRQRPQDFDADTRDRFLAGTLWPAGWYVRAQAVRRWWLEQMLAVFREVDIVIAPATPCCAPAVGTTTLNVRGELQALRPNLGLFTQPFSAVGLPVVSVPLWSESAGLPIGVQLVAAPWREDLCLRAARALETAGITLRATPPVSSAGS
ncbi:AtzE family amidohydrolase [Mangrovimicrobium sediminis]|uniref:AtzE family amidohydrolase n=1 Tax=Mangrovimicrobium sediminis TaxID=2562682 RepID=A0A4Z0M506_9GAMM|nr:AtzE family amidohydrolase [Haliea sp. SAOS-164]TGD74589.1 AtzE family amidohydrolase [Haliea sp. SAOS-164]